MMLLKYAAVQVGIALAVFTLWAAADSWYLAASSSGPVIKRSQTSGEPLAELSKIDGDVLRRGAIYRIGGGLALWLLAA